MYPTILMTDERYCERTGAPMPVDEQVNRNSDATPNVEIQETIGQQTLRAARWLCSNDHLGNIVSHTSENGLATQL